MHWRRLGTPTLRRASERTGGIVSYAKNPSLALRTSDLKEGNLLLWGSGPIGYRRSIGRQRYLDRMHQVGEQIADLAFR